MVDQSQTSLLARIEELENRLEESEQLIDAIKAGEVDAFAINADNKSEIYTLQSGDYAYRVLIEEFGEGAINVTEEGLIVYTNPYFLDLIKLPYEKVIGSFISDFVNKNYKTQFNELFAKALTGKSKGELKFSVNNEEVPVYISFTSLQPKLATVGIIITDLSEKKKNEETILRYQNDLETKNIELLQSNAELASFAYIASHDLQEPLRKIQTFSSRILDIEDETFSDEAKDYFKRIIGASSRMKSLITALLDYSRINTSDIVFVPTDLNDILEDVKLDLNELIAETNATIESGNLPVLNAIPHQMNQLLSNLILNAIKFKKRDVAPVIKLTAEIADAPTINEGVILSSSRRFWKINFEDNGIGFDSQYADKIFELFQRLHARAEYEGTGIGLAICKKIVQNNGGFISATSAVGEGASFHIYIPVKE